MKKLGFTVATLLSIGLLLAALVFATTGSGVPDCTSLLHSECRTSIQMSKAAGAIATSFLVLALFSAPHLLKRISLLSNYANRLVAGGLIAAAISSIALSAEVKPQDVEPVCEARSHTGCTLLLEMDRARVEGICQRNPGNDDPDASALHPRLHPACRALRNAKSSQ